MKFKLPNHVLLLCLLLGTTGVFAQINLVTDLNPGPADGVVGDSLVQSGFQTYFIGNTPATGREVYLSYGLYYAVPLEINPGPASGADSGSLTWFKNRLWFTGTSPATGTELWSAVSGAGSIQVYDLVPGSQSSNPRIVGQSNNFLYFIANNANDLPALWRYEGPWAGPVEMFSDIGGHSPALIDQFVILNNEPYFTLSGPASGKIWKISTINVQLVVDIQVGGSADITELTAVGDQLYFAGDDDGDGVYEPWISDGSTFGTVKLIDTGAGPRPKWFTQTTYYTYFAMGTKSIWRTDGTPAGTQLAANISASVSDNEPVNWIADGPNLYFAGYEAATGREFWLLNPFNNGLHLLMDLNPGPGSSSPTEFCLTDDGLHTYFQAYVEGYGRALYHYDMLEDTAAAFLNSPPVTAPRSIKFRWGNHLSFIADHPDYGAELFVLGSLPVGVTAPEFQTVALSLEPNPAIAQTRLILPESCRWQEGRLRLYDSMGALRWEGPPAGTTTLLQLNDLPAGTYWVEYAEPSGRTGCAGLLRN